MTWIDTAVRKHPEHGVIIISDFNPLRNHVLKTHYRCMQVVNVVRRGQAILENIWMAVKEVFTPPVTTSELGSSGHNIFLLKPKSKR